MSEVQLDGLNSSSSLSSSGQHNDARMNLAIGLTAARYGAVMANYTEVVHLLKTKDPQTDKEKVCGARCRDVLTGKACSLSLMQKDICLI